MSKYFGTDGIRGRYPLELSNGLAFKLGQSLQSVLGTKTLVLGMDTRESSSELLYSVAAGAQSLGINVIIAGVVSTPMISYYCMIKQLTGVMITASHNPYTDNGIKVLHNGLKLSEELEQKIEDYIDGNVEFTIRGVGALTQSKDIEETYIKLIESLNLPKFKMRIGLDSANGANYMIASRLFSQYADFYLQIGDQPDGKNINHNVGSTHLEAIQKLVEEHQLDIGLSFDGDGDRILVVDSDQSVIDGDELIYILASYLQDQNKLNKDTVVLTKMSNLGIIKAFEKRGIDVVLTNIGDKYVLEECLNNDYSIGGENSGHIILKDLINTGDGLLVALVLLKLLEESNKSLKDYKEEITMWPQILHNIRTYNKEILQDDRVVTMIKQVQDEVQNNGKVLVRASGTEPLIRVTISLETEELTNHYLNKIVTVINQVKEEV